MDLKQKLIIGLLFCVVLSCSNDDDTFIQPPVNTTIQTNIYPKPPSGWFGETNTYSTTGWVGDVMPYFDNDKFYLYFLHDALSKPEGKGFHDIHSFQTSNFTEFDYEGRMIPYGETYEPDFGVGTGSVIKVGNTYYFYYTGHNGIPLFLQSNPRESVLCATSSDLKNWTKVDDFKLTAPMGYLGYDFRDPHVFYNEEDGKYWMLMSTQTEPGRKAVVLLFTTDNPATNNWTVQSPVYTTTAQENYLMMECADMFKMGSYWYLIFSENWSDYKGTRYRMATSPNGPWITPEVDRFDGEYLYAAKTASNGNTRFLFGWTARKVPETNTGNKEWAGNMVIHQLVQNANGTLSVKQPESVSSLFNNSITIEEESSVGNVTKSNNALTLDGLTSKAMVTYAKLNKSSQITFTFSMQSKGDSGLLLNYVSETNTSFKIAFEPDNKRIAAYNVIEGNDQYVNQIPFQFVEGEEYHLNIITNEDMCVVYINDQLAFSNRLYGTIGKKWGIYANTGKVVFSNITLKSIN
ncbi:glycoside hydrolase family 32 protein [Confluentibacter flavum]|uniref:beta-fructofuranosidase n=1 Tax=Confluentibacter flavum TaxID=1909700 RepID=A0A2N3HK65_9FLAO|nr:glycoside hydrolase family 32 protein [Confluentibacter flavum]PKQ45365.1 hypothetical protein CSW08_08320 [Confluentibacter flavum]